MFGEEVGLRQLEHGFSRRELYPNDLRQLVTHEGCLVDGMCTAAHIDSDK